MVHRIFEEVVVSVFWGGEFEDEGVGHAFAVGFPGRVLAHLHRDHVGLAIGFDAGVLQGGEGSEVRFKFCPWDVGAVLKEHDMGCGFHFCGGEMAVPMRW